MDIVLELTDTFIADYAYAALLPARPEYYDYPQAPASNASVQSYSPWTYKPATSYFRIEPSQAAYMSAWTRDNIYRQAFTLFLITWVFGFITYFLFASLSFYTVFDKKTLQHPKFLKNQIWLEIKQTNISMPFMAICTAPLFLLDVRGYGKFYDDPADAPAWWYNYLQFPFFLVFTDFWIYWIHRGLHHPLVYKTLHKRHHKWIMPTPFASHAFHPLDGFAQSLPYHVFPLLFPLQKLAFVALFVFVNFWTILIHDGEFISNNPLINGAACHSLHHSKFEVNYGQFFTFLDRLGGTYRQPENWMFEKEEKMSEKQWKLQVQDIDDTVREVEGDDYRAYEPLAARKNK